MQKTDGVHQTDENVPDPLFVGNIWHHALSQLEQVQVAFFNYKVAEGGTGDLNQPEADQQIGVLQVFEDFDFRLEVLRVGTPSADLLLARQVFSLVDFANAVFEQLSIQKFNYFSKLSVVINRTMLF